MSRLIWRGLVLFVVGYALVILALWLVSPG